MNKLALIKHSGFSVRSGRRNRIEMANRKRHRAIQL